MHRTSGIAAIVVLFILSASALYAQKQSDNFTFVAVSDFSQSTGAQNDSLNRFVTDSLDAEHRAAFVVANGNLTETGKADEFLRLKEGFARLFNAGMKVYAVPGNHDVRWNPGGKEELTKQFGKPYQSFDYQGCHFLLLDSTVALEHWGHLDKAQIDWLERDLKRLRADTPIFVFLHHTIGRDTAATRLIDNEFDLIRRLSTHNVIAIFTGHSRADASWKTNGVETLSARGVRQGSYYRVTVTPVLVTIDRVYTDKPGPVYHAAFPVTRRTKPSVLRAGWDDPDIPYLERRRPAATLEPRAVTDVPDREKAEYRIDGAAWKALTKDQRDIWRDVFPTKQISVGIHTVDVRLTTSTNVTLADELIFEVERGAEEPVRRWALDLDGPIQSSPALESDTLYVTSLDGHAYALKTDRGKKQWSFPTKGPIVGSPLVSDGAVYFGSSDHNLYCVDARNGRQRWRFDAGSALASTPAIASGVVCIGATGEIFGIDAATGVQKWHQAAGASFQSRAATDGSTFYLGGWDNTLYALDALTGKPRWTKRLGRSFNYSPAIASPYVIGERVYICTNDNTLYALDARNGADIWSINAPRGGDPLGYSSPVVAGSTLYVAGLGDNGEVYAIDTAKGDIKWRGRIGRQIYDSSVTIAPDGKSLAIMAVRGRVAVLDTASGTVMWQYELGPGNIFSTPAYDGSTVYTVTMANDVQAINAPRSGVIPVRRARKTPTQP